MQGGEAVSWNIYVKQPPPFTAEAASRLCPRFCGALAGAAVKERICGEVETGGFRMSGIRWKDAGGGILAEPLWKGSGFRAG